MLRNCLVLLTLMLGSGHVLGDVVITFVNASVTTNGTGFMDVLITTQPGERLTVTGFQFDISGSPNLNGSLSFLQASNPLSFSPPNYVFGPATGNYGDAVSPSTTISGGDYYESGVTSVELTGATETLVRLNLQHTAVGLPAAAVGDTFTISLVNSLTTEFTFYDVINDVLVPLDIDGSSFSTFGTITISAAAVPEPGTLGAMAVAVLVIAGRRIRRRKSTREIQATSNPFAGGR